MRGSSFLKGIGRRRAAMIGGEVPAVDDADEQTINPMYDMDEATGDDGSGPSEESRHFGLVRAGPHTGEAGQVADQDERIDVPSEDVSYRASEAPGSMPDRPAQTPSTQTTPARTTPAQTTPAQTTNAKTVSQGPDGPVVSTPHLERLRAQFGDEPGDVGPEPAHESLGARQPGGSGGNAQVENAPLATPAAPTIPARAKRPGDDVAPSPPQEPVGNPVDRTPSIDDDPVDQQPTPDPIEEIAVTIGRVVSIRASVVWGALFDDIDGKASKAARMGALVSMQGPDSRVFGIVNRLEREQQAGTAQSERTVFEIQILGEIADEKAGFQRGVSSYPPLDARITTITIRDIAMIYARPRCANVHIGRLRHNARVPAFILTDSLLGKHFAVLGTTGTGKSCATTVILRSILDEHPEGHVVLIDPHNEYGPAFADRAELLNPGNLQLPYWLLNFEEIAHVVLHGASRELLHSQGALLKDAIVKAKTQFAGANQEDSVITVDTPVPYRLSDLISILKEGMGTLNKAEGSSLYLSLINRIEALRADRRFAFMFSSLAVRDNMEQVLAQLLRIPANGKPVTIIDISGLPSDVVDVVVSVLFRLTFELAVWSERGKAPPVLLVCEEAHRYVPEQSDVGFAPTKRVIAQIAKEGRKYGVTLCLVSQRPSELAVSSLAQCNTIFALRLGNEHDQAFVSQTLPENARWLVDSLPSLNTQEAVVVGDGVTVPVHIRFRHLAPQHRPASHDPSFAKSWCKKADSAFLGRAIDRWRRQAR